jgi:hypothetical protein
MNYQEQGLGTPETAYSDLRPFNTDPREQPQRPVGPYMPTGRPPQRGHSPWYWLIVGLVIVGAILGGLAVANLAFSKTITETKTFAVGNQPTLVLSDGNGSVHVARGPANQITIVAHKHLPSYQNDAIHIQYQQSSDGNTITVQADENSGFNINLFDFNVWADFDVTVPSQANLSIKAGNGSVDAQDISGQIALSSDNGSVTAGNISGQMTMHSGNGSITVTNGQASGSSTFEDGNGSITFSGTLDPRGTDLFTTGNGSIDLTLPANASFHVQATTGNGSTDSDFPGLLNNNGTLVGSVGSAPFAQITMHTGNGSIHLHQGA